MDILKTSLDKITELRRAHLETLPEFQELYLELMVPESESYMLRDKKLDLGYAIKSNEGILIEYYLKDQYISISPELFPKLIQALSIREILCKTFDSFLLSNCLLNSFSYEVVGVLYRDSINPEISKDPEIMMLKANLSSIEILANQDDSINELFETESQLKGFIENGHVFMFYKDNVLAGCGMVLRTHKDWNFCDLGIWVSPAFRRLGIGTQILLDLKSYALRNQMIPGCGCAIENIASQKTIEKAGFYSKHKLLSFKTN